MWGVCVCGGAETEDGQVGGVVFVLCMTPAEGQDGQLCTGGWWAAPLGSSMSFLPVPGVRAAVPCGSRVDRATPHPLHPGQALPLMPIQQSEAKPALLSGGGMGVSAEQGQAPVRPRRQSFASALCGAAAPALCAAYGGGGWEPAARALHPPSAAQAAGAQGQKRERPRHVLRLKCHLLCSQGRSRKTGSRKSGPASVLGLRAAHSRPHRPSASTPAWSSPALSASLSALSLRKGSLPHLRVSVEVGGSAASAPRRPRPARGILAPGMALHWHQRGLAARLQ